MMIGKRTLLAIAAVLATCAVSAQTIVSYNFDNTGTVGGDGAGSGPVAGATAGIASATNWYNDWPSYPNTDLSDNTGAPTTMDIGWWSNGGTWNSSNFGLGHVGADADGSWNMEMLHGYLNSGNGSVVGIDLKEIPFAEYDVYVYFASDVNTRTGMVMGKERALETDPWGAVTTYYFQFMNAADANIGVGNNAVLTLTTDMLDDAATTQANYAVFHGSMDYFNIELLTDNNEWGGVTGLQVVAVPEPATIALVLGALSLGLILIRRRRR